MENFNNKVYDGIIEIREDIATIKQQFINLNGSVKKHKVKIGKIEKILYIALGIFGTLQFVLTTLT